MQNGSYASVWKVTKGKGNYYDVRLSCSRKRKDTNEYVTDFQGFTRFCGTAATQIAAHDGFDAKENGNKPLRIKIGNFSVSNSYDRNKDITYWNVAVFSYDDPNGESNGQQKQDDGFVDVPDGIEDELPFE